MAHLQFNSAKVHLNISLSNLIYKIFQQEVNKKSTKCVTGFKMDCCLQQEKVRYLPTSHLPKKQTLFKINTRHCCLTAVQ